MKTTQVVSGFLLGTSLLIPSQLVSAQVVFDDGGVHILNDASLRNEYIQVLGSTTLRLEAGAEIGGAFNELGMIDVFDTATVILAGGSVGVGGGSSGLIMLYDDSQLVIEDGVLGGEAPSSGQVIGMGRSSVIVRGGQMGGTGEQSGLIGLFDTALGEIRGGRFGGGGSYSGLVLGFASSQFQVFACESSVPFGPVEALDGQITTVTKAGASLDVLFMREATAQITVVEDCDGGDPEVDTDGDGVPDAADLCIESDLRPTLWIFNINTCIPNLIDGQAVNGDGCSLADLVNAMIDEASENSRNRFEFLRAVARGLQEMKRDGLLPGRFHRHFQNCALRCNWDDAKKYKRHDSRDQRRRR